MAGLDKERISKIIESNTSENYSNFSKKQQDRINEKTAAIKKRLEAVTPAEWARAEKEMDELAAKLECHRDLRRDCVHIDMDAYFAAVEMRDDPRLRTVPMAVGSMAMLSTSNYIARRFGVRAAMPGFIAKKLCPQLELVHGNYDKYKRESAIFEAIFAEYDEDVSMGSLDEAYLELTAYVHDRLSVRLHPNVLVDPNYLKLKAQVRCLLFEPTLLAMAIEPPEVEELRLKKQMELVQMEIDEENYVADAVVMDEAVAGEVEVTTEDYEPLYYEDIVDDALNATVRTVRFSRVVDKVCYTPPKRKRGRPRKDDLLAACERGARVNRRQSLPRSAKNNMPLVVMEANSVSDDDLSLGGYDSDPGQSELSQEQDTYIEVALTDEDHVQDVMQSILEQVCRMVDQPKRKRGRPRKSDIAQQLVLEPKPKRR
ncbi:hypothetical protein ANCDUO_17503 [Ancylostoma duodenale]|uniref:UmuC domain-containing protein n=1 Tax=Ancylostoma duodenale TaxID=51022 RepID=A0A0C2G5R4_9BILA|nr:hypothetical protein ANCDUO_17503 [Ancylostoma duodenale]